LKRRAFLNIDSEQIEEQRNNELIENLRWWKLGSTNEEEHGFRMK
jgi:hypothetical protein